MLKESVISCRTTREELPHCFGGSVGGFCTMDLIILSLSKKFSIGIVAFNNFFLIVVSGKNVIKINLIKEDIWGFKGQ